jgi:hypothetical protein
LIGLGQEICQGASQNKKKGGERMRMQGYGRIRKRGGLLPALLFAMALVLCALLATACSAAPTPDDAASSANPLSPSVSAPSVSEGSLFADPAGVPAGTFEALATYERSVMLQPEYQDEWKIIYLARGGLLTEEEKAAYLDNLASTAEREDGILNARLCTEYARVVLAVTAVGGDAADVGGYNLLEPLAHFDRVVSQGVNGPIFALIALDSKGYELPLIEDAENQASRERYLSYLINAELGHGTETAGGFALAPTDAPFADLTAMALQALAPYYGTGVPGLDEVVDRGLLTLTAFLEASEDFSAATDGLISPETYAQIIIASNALGIEPDDELIAALMEYRVELGEEGLGFSHVLGGDANPMTSEQVGLALLSTARCEQGASGLYDMVDA